MTERRKSKLHRAVSNAAEKLQNSYLGREDNPASEAAARGVLAELRRHTGQRPEKAPLAFEKALSYVYPVLLDETADSYATYDEEAAFHALTLFALHMQSATQPMHTDKRSFARACGLMYAHGESESLKPRFDAVLTANSYESQLYHVRSLVTLLRAKDLGFDYGAFAQDLKTLQGSKFANSVLLSWGRDFASAPFVKNNNDKSEKVNTSDSHSNS